MGNSQSNNYPLLAPPPPPPPLRKKRSITLSHSLSSLGCISDEQISSDPVQETVAHFIAEKAKYNDLDRFSFPYTTVAHIPTNYTLSRECVSAYYAFLREFPEYRSTWTLDSLRRNDYGRLERTGETYVDYMGGSLYPESLIRLHTAFLTDQVLGNTHSVNNSSTLSKKCADEARAAVLSFFDAPPDYTVVFTANASGALKLVGESYPFNSYSSYVLSNDSHNSVHGIREFANRRGAKVAYIPSTPIGGMDLTAAKRALMINRPFSRELSPCLFALTGQSNITNTKNPLSILDFATSLGYNTILDAAALAPSSHLSLSKVAVDAVAISFYKMFGYPTGVGALIVKKSFLEKLRRPWFAGGTVDVVQVPGNIVTYSHEIYEQFEDGTINYLSLPAITDGLKFLATYMPLLPLRLSCLMYHLTEKLNELRHETSKTPVVRILSRLPNQRLKGIGEQTETFGATISLIFLSPKGELIPNSFIEYSASKQNISLRTGCMCNPGGAAAILGIEQDMEYLYQGVTLEDFERHMGRELGVIRISLGLASNFQDVWNCIKFAASVGKEEERQKLWSDWMTNHGQKQEI